MNRPTCSKCENVATYALSYANGEAALCSTHAAMIPQCSCERECGHAIPFRLPSKPRRDTQGMTSAEANDAWERHLDFIAEGR